MSDKGTKIDIVITWLDEKDEKWQAERQACFDKSVAEEESNSNIRFEGWDNIRLWFRAIEETMPWVHKIFFITYGHVPSFLDTKHPKLRIIRHDEFIPNEYLPTFNSNTMEMNLHRIEDLSENFILFNDDFFPLQHIEEEYYFKDGMVCDEAVENIITTASFGPVSNMARYTQVNNMFIINKYFRKREVQEKNWDKWYCEDYGDRLERTRSLQYWNDFPGFYDPHLASAMKKSILNLLWELEGDVLDRASRNHFRAYSDVTQYLVRYWQLCRGDFHPRRTKGKVFFVDINNYKEVAESIDRTEYQMVSLNENCSEDEFVTIKDAVNSALRHRFPEKCSFEL